MGQCFGNRSHVHCMFSTAEKLDSPVSHPSRGTYQAVEPARGIPDLVGLLRWHAVKMWTTMLALVLVQALPAVQPTCAEGISTCLLAGVAALLALHGWAEVASWQSACQLLTQPELVIVHHYGLHRRRFALVLLGLFEALDIFTDASFVVMAHDCHSGSDLRYFDTLDQLPVVGSTVKSIVRAIGLGGVTAVFFTLNTAIELYSMKKAFRLDYNTQQVDPEHPARIPGDVFFKLAKMAEVAMLPSVASVCQEMGESKAHVYNPHKDSRATTAAHDNVLLGKIDFNTAQAMELEDEVQRQSVQVQRRRYYLLVVMVKVVLGNVPQLWLQTTFLQVSFKVLGPMAKVQLLCSMAFSSVRLCVRCLNVSYCLGEAGLFFLVFMGVVVAWAFANTFFAFQCEHHLWHLGTGCFSAPEI